MRARSVLLLFLALLPTLCLAGSGLSDAADTDPGLFWVMMILLLGFMAALIGVLALVALAVLAFCLLAAMGTVTLAAAVAWYRRSLMAGLRTAVYFSATLVGLGAGAFAGWVFVRWYEPHWPTGQVLLCSTLVGGLGAIVCARVLLFVLAGIAKHFVERQVRR